jgi:uncharacterized membrane protein
MHLIPQSWAHFHILVSVFPSVGLVFVLGVFIAACVTNNHFMKLTALVFFVGLAVLAIPTYMSGDGATSALADNPRFAHDLVDTHRNWSYAALAAIGITGIAALVSLWRYWSGGKISDQALNTLFWLAVITLVLMAVAGELGWEINHTELRLDPAAQKTSQVWSHFHMILNHFPTVGFVIALTYYIIALIKNDVTMRRTGLVLLVVCAILGVPTYVTGNASMWALTDPLVPGISKALINEHRDMALLTLFGLAFTGVTAWIEVWRYRHLGRFSTGALYLVLVFSLITLAIMAETGHRGGQINHPEIRLATDLLPPDDAASWSVDIERAINHVMWFVPWQTVHFFGYCFVFGTALAVALRVLGLWKSVSFEAVHRILPLGVFGVAMNVFSGMLILQADSSRYLNEATFVPRIAFITIGALAVLYFSVSERLWRVKAGEDAPAGCKWVAGLVLLAWVGVITGGRLLPYL